MEITQAEFIKSSTDISQCPPPDKKEYAFIGRSNVGKSSLINMLSNNKKLAKISGTPGKTQTINHFIMNNDWYLVDLPGYGYAKTSRTNRKEWTKFIKDYVLKRENLINLFLLVDSRHAPQKIDLEFMSWLGYKQVPFSIVFTKIDKLSSTEFNKNITNYKKELLKHWESLPKTFVSSSTTKIGKLEILQYIDHLNNTI